MEFRNIWNHTEQRRCILVLYDGVESFELRFFRLRRFTFVHLEFPGEVGTAEEDANIVTVEMGVGLYVVSAPVRIVIS